MNPSSDKTKKNYQVLESTITNISKIKNEKKIAELSVNQNQYQEAIHSYENVINILLESSTTIINANIKKHYIKLLLCWLIFAARNNFMIKFKEKVQEYKGKYYQFDEIIELKLIESMANKFDEEDLDGFTDEIIKYDSIKKLDSWEASLLLEVKAIIKRGKSEEKTDKETSKEIMDEIV